ncbi:HNH endonuclease [Gordonia phage ClubL]|uniref:HNH endonuclease n=1 Tax=Gordonia phage ClubL TaxID=1838065 RepID=A0A160DF88_9CAUD|nr:HNH endonuclease [Gordonia phage ClubL]ANA86646.1 HNH endonuclease [Gordonia phage ClubL]
MPPRGSGLQVCQLGWCDRPHYGKGLCEAHLWRQKRGISLETPLRALKRSRGCSVDDCSRPHKARGFCQTHDKRARLGLDLDDPIRGEVNKSASECLQDGCGRRPYARGLCDVHNRRSRNGIPMGGPIRTMEPGRECSRHDCRDPHLARGLCKKHYSKEGGRGARYMRDRKARLADLGGDQINPEAWSAKVEYWGGRCWMCGSVPAVIEMDHVKPVSRGGCHIIANLRPACRSCNARKGNRWPFQVVASV